MRRCIRLINDPPHPLDTSINYYTQHFKACLHIVVQYSQIPWLSIGILLPKRFPCWQKIFQHLTAICWLSKCPFFPMNIFKYLREKMGATEKKQEFKIQNIYLRILTLCLSLKKYVYFFLRESLRLFNWSKYLACTELSRVGWVVLRHDIVFFLGGVLKHRSTSTMQQHWIFSYIYFLVLTILTHSLGILFF